MRRHVFTAAELDQAVDVVLRALRQLPREACGDGYVLPRGGFRKFVVNALNQADVNVTVSMVVRAMTKTFCPVVKCLQRGQGRVCIIIDYPAGITEESVRKAVDLMRYAAANRNNDLPDWITTDLIHVMLQNDRLSDWLTAIVAHLANVVFLAMSEEEKRAVDTVVRRLHRILAG